MAKPSLTNIILFYNMSIGRKELFIKKCNIWLISLEGGRVKSEAAIDTNVTSAPVKESRNFNVDDTFAIFLKESSRDMPYFAARIDNIKKYQ